MALPSRGSTQRWATSHCTASWKILRLFEFQASKLLGFHSPKAPCHMTLKPRLWAAHVLLPAPVERQERCCRHVNFKGSPIPAPNLHLNLRTQTSQAVCHSLSFASGDSLPRLQQQSEVCGCGMPFWPGNLIHHSSRLVQLAFSMQIVGTICSRLEVEPGSSCAWHSWLLPVHAVHAHSARALSTAIWVSWSFCRSTSFIARRVSWNRWPSHCQVRKTTEISNLTMHAELLVQMVLPRHRLHCKLQTPCRLVGTRRSLCVGFLQSAQWTEGRPVEVSLNPLVAIVTPKFPQSSNWISVWKATLRRQLLDVRIYWCCWRTDSGPCISSLFKTGTVDWTPTEQMFQDMSRI